MRSKNIAVLMQSASSVSVCKVFTVDSFAATQYATFHVANRNPYMIEN